MCSKAENTHQLMFLCRSRSRIQLRGGYMYRGLLSQNADYTGTAGVTTTTFIKHAFENAADRSYDFGIPVKLSVGLQRTYCSERNHAGR